MAAARNSDFQVLGQVVTEPEFQCLNTPDIYNGVQRCKFKLNFQDKKERGGVEDCRDRIWEEVPHSHCDTFLCLFVQLKAGRQKVALVISGGLHVKLQAAIKSKPERSKFILTCLNKLC